MNFFNQNMLGDSPVFIDENENELNISWVSLDVLTSNSESILKCWKWLFILLIVSNLNTNLVSISNNFLTGDRESI